MNCCSCVSLLFARSLAAVKRRDSRDRWVHLLAGHLRPGEQRLGQLLHPTGALSSIRHHRVSPHCQQHWKNPTLSDAHEAWKKRQWLSLTPGLSLFIFFVPFQVWTAWRKDFSVFDPREKGVYKWWILFEMGILLFVLMFCLNSLPDGLFLLSVHCTWSFLLFFSVFISPFWWKEKKKFFWEGGEGKISVPCVFLALFRLFWVGVHLVRVVKIYIETVYSYMYDIHIKHTYINI